MVHEGEVLGVVKIGKSDMIDFLVISHGMIVFMLIGVNVYNKS